MTKSLREKIETKVAQYNALADLALRAIDVSNNPNAAATAAKDKTLISSYEFEQIIQDAWYPPASKHDAGWKLPKDRIPAERITQEAADAHLIPEVCESLHKLPGEVGSRVFMQAWHSGEIAQLLEVCSGARFYFDFTMERAQDDAEAATKEHGLPFAVTEYGWVVPPRDFNPFTKELAPGYINSLRQSITTHVLWGYDPEEPLPEWFPGNSGEGAYAGWETPEQRIPVNRWAGMGTAGHREGIAVREIDGLYMLAQVVTVPIEVGKTYPARVLGNGDRYQIPGDDRIHMVKGYNMNAGIPGDTEIVFLGGSKVKAKHIDPDEFEDDDSDENPLATDDADEEAQPAAPPSLFDAIE